MGDLSAFLRCNAAEVENVRFAPSQRFVENGKAVEWEIRCISATEDEELRRSCTRRAPAARGRGPAGSETDINLYLGRLAALGTVYPDLRDKGLQDSYGVMGADSLLKAMLTPGEYADYLMKVQEVCGFDRSFQELVDEAKKLIREGDYEAGLSLFCLHEFHLLPSDFLKLERRERAFLAAAAELRVQDRKKKV